MWGRRRQYDGGQIRTHSLGVRNCVNGENEEEVFPTFNSGSGCHSPYKEDRAFTVEGVVPRPRSDPDCINGSGGPFRRLTLRLDGGRIGFDRTTERRVPSPSGAIEVRWRGVFSDSINLKVPPSDPLTLTNNYPLHILYLDPSFKT